MTTATVTKPTNGKQAATAKPKTNGNDKPATNGTHPGTYAGKDKQVKNGNGKSHNGDKAKEQLVKAKAEPVKDPRPAKGLFIEVWKDTKNGEWLFFGYSDMKFIFTSPQIWPVNGKLSCVAQAKVTAKALGIKVIVEGNPAAGKK